MKKLFIIATALFLSFTTLTSTTMAAETRNYAVNSENAEIVPFDADIISKTVYKESNFKYDGKTYSITLIYNVLYNSRTGEISDCILTDWYSDIKIGHSTSCTIMSTNKGTYSWQFGILVTVEFLGTPQASDYITVTVAP